MATILGDIRYAARLWSRNPGFTAVALLTLALGIGANTVMFSVFNATLLQPVPFPDPDRLVTIWGGRTDNPDSLSIVSLPNYRDWRSRTRSFESQAIFDSAGRGYNLTGDREPEQVPGLRVTASFFSVLGVEPLLGRTFRPEEEQRGRDRVVVLSHALWTRRYGADPAIVGRAIRVDGMPHQVVGVMPPEFRFQFWSAPRQLWVPAGWTEGDQDRRSNSFIAIARLKRSVSLEEARAELEAIGRALAQEYSQENAGGTLRVVPVSEYGVGDLRRGLTILLTLVGFVLLIACVNVANLMLARAAVRQRELAIRRALGASRGRIVQQMLTESVLLAVGGGAAGLLLAVWGISLLVHGLPSDLTRLPLRPLEDVDLDSTVLAFTLGIACLSGVLFGLAPAASAFRGEGTGALRDQARGSTPGRIRQVGYALVASEVALTLVTLAGAAAMILSVARLLGVHPGLDPRNVLVLSLSLPQENLYYGPPDHPRFCEDLEQQAGGVAGVQSVSAIAHLPLGGGGAGRSVAIEGRPRERPSDRPGAGYTVACTGVLHTLGIRLVSGREFTHRDTASAPGVALVNRTMASRFWPGQDAVGKRFQAGDDDEPWLTVVGVFEDVRHWGLHRTPQPSFIRPYTQAAWPVMSVVAKTAAPPLGLAAPLKKALAIVEPDHPVSGVLTYEEIVSASVSSRRFPMLLLSGFALLALVLAAVGIAGVVGYAVAQRTQEIGVRMALGARHSDVLRLVMGSSLWWTLAGTVVGLGAAFGLLRLLGSALYDVAPTDPLVLGSVSLLMLGVSLGASYLPARRAMQVDPVTALRCE
jgi:putative ABC transport system permease protein